MKHPGIGLASDLNAHVADLLGHVLMIDKEIEII